MGLAPTTIRTELRGAERWLLVEGDLDLEGAAALREAFEAWLPATPGALVVDLSGAEFVESLGLSELLACGRDAHLAGVQLRVYAPRGHQARVLMELSGTAGALQVLPD